MLSRSIPGGCSFSTALFAALSFVLSSSISSSGKSFCSACRSNFSIRTTLWRCSSLVCHGSDDDLVVSFAVVSSSLSVSVSWICLLSVECPHLPLPLPLAFPGGAA